MCTCLLLVCDSDMTLSGQQTMSRVFGMRWHKLVVRELSPFQGLGERVRGVLPRADQCSEGGWGTRWQMPEPLPRASMHEIRSLSLRSRPYYACQLRRINSVQYHHLDCPCQGFQRTPHVLRVRSCRGALLRAAGPVCVSFHTPVLQTCMDACVAEPPTSRRAQAVRALMRL